MEKTGTNHLREECVATKRQASTYADNFNVDHLAYTARTEFYEIHENKKVLQFTDNVWCSRFNKACNRHENIPRWPLPLMPAPFCQDFHRT